MKFLVVEVTQLRWRWLKDKLGPPKHVEGGQNDPKPPILNLADFRALFWEWGRIGSKAKPHAPILPQLMVLEHWQRF